MNTEVLQHLGHGRLHAVTDVQELRPGSVLFQDGREEKVDVVLWATGYERAFPFLDHGSLDASAERLDVYLNVFHRRHPTLSFMGLFETDGAAYDLFGLQADLVAGYLAARRSGDPAAQRFDVLRADHRPDLQGGRRYVNSPRHAHYVRGDTYRRILRRLRKQMGWG